MPAQQFGSPLACWKKGGREQCGKTDVLFKQMEADLFNLKPAIGEVNGDRAHYRFGMLPAQAPQYGSCEVKVDFKSRLVEPRAAIRGDIARIHFYMADKYQIPLAKAQQQLFMAWHQQDPVDETERKLQQRIAQQMGHANDFVGTGHAQCDGLANWHVQLLIIDRANLRCRCTANINDQLGDALNVFNRAFRVDTALKAMARVG